MSPGLTTGRCSTWRIAASASALRRLMARIARGEPVDPAKIYFRSTPRFETAATRYQWLTRPLFLAAGVRYPARVALSVFEVG